METSTRSQASPAPSTFAGVLSKFVLPPRAIVEETSEWGGELGEDVATLSYESALRAHARYKAEDSSVWPEPRSDANPLIRTETQATVPADAESATSPQNDREELRRVTALDLRSASVTVRLSKTELEQLRQRAAEAGVTLSAYLRSCTLEAEALRAQVKAALAEMKNTREQGSKGARERASEGAGEQGRDAGKGRRSRGLERIGRLWFGFASRKAN